jgi:cytoskeletal protein RodZ
MLPAPRNDTFPELLTTTPIFEPSSSEDSGIFSSWWVMILIWILLFFFGFIIYSYLAKGAMPSANDIFSDIWTHLTSIYSYSPISESTTSQENEPESHDDKPSENGDTTETSTTTEINTQPSPASLSKITPSKTEQPAPDNAQNTALNRALNLSKQQEQTKQEYVASDSYENSQQGKAGWCYIGSDQGYRSCSQVGEADTCMSGNIFPTQDICVNPNLRT